MTGSRAFGTVRVAGRNLVPNPAIGMTAFRTVTTPLHQSRIYSIETIPAYLDGWSKRRSVA